MLQISKINKSFGGLKVLNNLSFKIEKGSISGLIGPNGAGKTTLFNVINGSIKPDSGSVQLNNYELIGLQPHELFEIGVLRTFQIPHEFFSLTVLDNLLVVPPNKIGETFFGQWFFEKKIKKIEEINVKKAKDILDILGLSHLEKEYAGNLSGGQKKLLELGRVMMVEPEIILLDEVGAGVNKTLLKKISNIIKKLNKEKKYTFIMIEHDLDFISKLCDTIIVMAEGQFLTQGKIQQIKSNQKVIDIYLGKS
ncbi:ABC transporter ATP-binding protein [Alphaproteobacteria bacterium]|nr:ABC transporter ATP-binding protein [Alphaproteobacteria bacterium]